MSDDETEAKVSSGDQAVSVRHARGLIEVYRKERPRDRPWYYEWSQTIDRLANALEAAGVPAETVEAIALGAAPDIGRSDDR